MIVKMKKLSLVVLASETDKVLINLADLGVLHIASERKPSEQLLELRDRHARIGRGKRRLAAYSTEEQEPDNPPKRRFHNAVELLDRLDEIDESENQLREELERLHRERDRIAVFGEFDPKDILELRESGVLLRLFLLTKSELAKIDENRYFTVARRGSLTGIAIADDLEVGEVPEFRLPEFGTTALNERILLCNQQLELLTLELRDMARQSNILDRDEREIESDIEFELARTEMEVDGDLSYVTGFAPDEMVASVNEAAKQHGWALLVRDPEEADPVPTMVRNKKAIGIIKPVFQLLGTIPGYREYDISFFFLLFFTLFFAMIIGDAGYGFVFLFGTLASVLSGRRKGASISTGQSLLLVLSVATIAWGSLTGTWFGSEAIAASRPFRWLIVSGFASFNPKSGENIKFFCFVIGTVQIILAHGWNFLAGLKVRPRIRAFGQLGWISMVAGIYYLVLSLVLDPTLYPMPRFALFLILGGAVAVLLFAEQDGNFFKGVAKGFGGLLTTFLDSIGAFADIISYIRLFAVGLATVEIAKSFNSMASDLGSSIVGIVGAILILGFGHALNLAMGALSVIVHGVRLNMLEFSGHLGMDGDRVHTP